MNLKKLNWNLLNTRKNILIFLLLNPFMFVFINCDTTEPTIERKEEKWEVISELANLNVRYILKHNNIIYLSAIESGRDYRGVIWKTTSGADWTILRTFNKAIGPMATNGDTLYCLGDSLSRYIISKDKWENICQPWPLTSDVQAVSEMIFLKNELYAMQTYLTDAVATYKINFDGTVEDLPVIGQSYGGAKFIKKESNNEWCYVRGQYHRAGFYTFNGNIFTDLRNGLTDKEWLNPPTNSMEIKNDTLFAGFREPGLIKYLDNDSWKSHTDTLPYFQEHSTWYYTEPTEITFVNERMFVSTNPLGVLEWNQDLGWLNLSSGLKEYGWDSLYYPVVFLESINETLIAAYGDPGYAPWGGIGVYKYKLKK